MNFRNKRLIILESRLTVMKKIINPKRNPWFYIKIFNTRILGWFDFKFGLDKHTIHIGWFEIVF